MCVPMVDNVDELILSTLSKNSKQHTKEILGIPKKSWMLYK